MKFDQTLMTLVRRNIEQNTIPMLLGEPGIGKSSWLTNLAALMHTSCFTLACNQLADKADLTGARLVPVTETQTDNNGNEILVTTGYKQVFYPHAVIHDAIEYAEKHPRETPILFLDELNRTTPDVTSEALSIPTLRSIGSKNLPNNLRVVIAGNDKGNVTSLDEASISRFVLYHVEPDVQTFFQIEPDLNPFIKTVLQTHPECIFCKKLIDAVAEKDNDDDTAEILVDDIIDDGEEMCQITTPRTISALSRFLNTFDNKELLQLLSTTTTVDGQTISVLQEAIEGHVGHTTFSAFLLNEISNNCMNVNNQQTIKTVPKPNCYDTMKACTDMTQLNSFISSMSNNDKSGCLVYALYEPQDNGIYIRTLAPAINNMEKNDVSNLMALAHSNQLDSENVQTLLSTNTHISTTLSIILEIN